MPAGDKVIDMQYVASLKRPLKPVNNANLCEGSDQQIQINQPGICPTCKIRVGSGPGQAMDYIAKHEQADKDTP